MALLFFVISFAVIIRVFAAADGLERKSRRRVKAALCAQSIAEAYSVSGDTGTALRLVFGEDIPGDSVSLDSDHVAGAGRRDHADPFRGARGFRRRYLLHAEHSV